MTEFLYDGTDLIGEYNHPLGNTNHTGDTLLRRYVHGSGTDDPLVWYEGASNATLRYFYSDYHGSIILYTNASGMLQEMYKYGPYGEPKNQTSMDSWTGPLNSSSRFRYTGQLIIPEAHLYYYKARVYDPVNGRFLQTDPIGSKDDLDLYAYTHDDPVNGSDPTGLLTAQLSFDGTIAAGEQDGATGSVAIAISYQNGKADFGIIVTNTYEGQGGGLAAKVGIQGGLSGGDIKSQDGYKLKLAADAPGFGVSYETKTDERGNPLPDADPGKGSTKAGGQKNNFGGNVKIGISAGGGVSSSVVQTRTYTYSDVTKAVDRAQESIKRTVDKVGNVVDKIKGLLPQF